MKHFRSSFLAWIALASLAALPIQAASAQTENGEPRFDFSFEGGTAEDLLNAVEKRGLNFIVPENANELPISKFNLKNVTAPEMFEALGMLVVDSNPDYFTLIDHPRLSNIWVLKMQPKPRFPQFPEKSEDDNSDKELERINRVAEEINKRREIRSVSASQLEAPRGIIVNSAPATTEAPNGARHEQPALITQPVNISEHLKRSSIEGISSLIQSTISAKTALPPERSEELKIDIKFHRETNVLILSGQRESVNLAIDALQQILLSEILPAKQTGK